MEKITDITWFKIRVDIFNDEKIKMIDAIPEADTIFRIWINLLSLAAKINDGGLIYLSENIPYTEEMLSTIFNRPLNTIRLALNTFKKFGMIEKCPNNKIYIVNFEKHQNKDALDKIRENNRIRQQKYREKQKTLIEDIREDKKRVDIETNVIVTLRYGELKNVKLTEEQYNKLIKEYGEKIITKYINSLSLYEKIEKYSDHNRTIRSWLNKDDVEKKTDNKINYKEIQCESLI